MVDTTAVQTLNYLLQQAISRTVIRDRYQGYHISNQEYRSLLMSYRASPHSFNHLSLHRYQPVVQDDATKQDLLHIISGALEQYIHDDMLQSAEIVTGGPLNGFHIDNMLEHLLTIAFVRGTEFVAKSFYECVEKTSIRIKAVTMIEGVRIENPIEVDEGIHLVPIPGDVNEFPPYLRTHPFTHVTEYFGRTLIVVDEMVSPVFARPDEEFLSNRLSSSFTRVNVNTKYPNFVEEEFCEALSLSINHAVDYVSWWSHINPDEVYAVNSSKGMTSHAGRTNYRFGTPSIEVDEQDVRDAMSLYVTRKNLSQKVTQRLRVPIDRWIKSKADKNNVDIFINLGTALESLYLGDINFSGELGFRLALRAAWHLGNDGQERVSLKKDFAKIYGLRSQAVHTGTLNESKASPEFTARAQDLCLKSIVRIIQNGKFPNWDQLVMGKEHTP